jgi:hypothetical protein
LSSAEAAVDEDDIRRLLGEVAERHGVVLRPDDPIFVTVTLNERLLQRYLDRAVAAAEQRLSLLTAEQYAGAKESAARIITDAAQHAAEHIRNAGTAVQDDLLALVRREVATARTAAAEAAKARRTATHVVAAAWLAVVAVAAGVIVGTYI